MATPEQLFAIRALVKETGKRAAEVVDLVGPSWGLSVFECARLKHEIETGNPSGEPPASGQLHARLKGIGISDDRLATIGVRAPARRVPSAEAQDARRAATEQQVARERQQRESDLAAWRWYRDADAFQRTQIRRSVGDAALTRGRALDTDPTTDDGPEAA